MMPFSRDDFISWRVVKGLEVIPHSIQSHFQRRIDIFEHIIEKKLISFNHMDGCESLVRNNRKIIRKKIG